MVSREFFVFDTDIMGMTVRQISKSWGGGILLQLPTLLFGYIRDRYFS